MPVVANVWVHYHRHCSAERGIFSDRKRSKISPTKSGRVARSLPESYTHSSIFSSPAKLLLALEVSHTHTLKNVHTFDSIWPRSYSAYMMLSQNGRHCAISIRFEIWPRKDRLIFSIPWLLIKTFSKTILTSFSVPVFGKFRMYSPLIEIQSTFY